MPQSGPRTGVSPPPPLARTRTGYPTPVPWQDTPRAGYGRAVRLLRFHTGGLSSNLWVSLITAEDNIDCNECIDTDRPVLEIRQEPYSLPSGFHWDTLDINDPMVVS